MSVGEDGCYVEKVHWARERHIGGGSCGRCYLCIDLNSNFLFAIKEVRLIFPKYLLLLYLVTMAFVFHYYILG